MTASPAILSVFDSFAASINGEVKVFSTYNEANFALVSATNSVEFSARAQAYADILKLDPKVAKAKTNVIEAFLTWEAAQPNVEVDSDVI